MRELDNLNKRLRYAGGNQGGRLVKDKLKSLKKALLYAYQDCTAVLSDGREFRCLINPDKTKNDYDQKILSIPFEDICLNEPREGKTSEGIVPIGVKGGDVIEWKENGTKWLVYLQFLEEKAYFRADVRRCKTEVEIDGIKYPIYIRGPVETTIKWLQKKGVSWNTLNYSLEMYITKNEQTLDFFHRFKEIKVDGKQWEVKAVDTYGGDGIIQVLLGETFSHTIEDEYYEELKPSEQVDTGIPYIKGLDVVKPYDTLTYTIENLDVANGIWKIDNSKIKIVEQTTEQIVIDVITGKSGSFIISYEIENEEPILLPVTIASL